MSCSVSSPNQRSTWLIQDEPVGVKCRWKRGWRASQSRMAGVLWAAMLSQTHLPLLLLADTSQSELGLFSWRAPLFFVGRCR